MKWYRHWINRLGLADKPRLRKLLVAVIGTTILLFGLALIVLPGPAIVIIPIGLALLATEFAWARRLIRRGGVMFERVRRRRRERKPFVSLGNDKA